MTFLLLHSAPGGPFERAVARIQRSSFEHGRLEMSPTILEKIQKQYHFDQPLGVRYWSWFKSILRLDFGESLIFRAPVTDVIWPRFLVSVKYGLWALPLCYGIAFLWALIHILVSRTELKFASSVACATLYCLPPLVLALGIKYTLQSDAFVVVLTGYILSHLAMMVFLFRGALLSEHTTQYSQVARAKGLSEIQVIFRHTLKNAMTPIASSLSYSVVSFFSGAVFLETVFRIDGLGLLSYKATLARDYNLMMGIVLFIAVLFLFARWIGDLLCGRIDPRVWETMR